MSGDTLPEIHYLDSEQRAEQRVLIERQARYRCPEHPVCTTSAVTDLSRSGVFIHTTRAIRPGSELEGSLRVDITGDDQPIDFVGRVCWSSQYDNPKAKQGPGIGVRFTRLAEEDRERLERLLDAPTQQ